MVSVPIRSFGLEKVCRDDVWRSASANDCATTRGNHVQRTISVGVPNIGPPGKS
jgi:hypothetical protein